MNTLRFFFFSKNEFQSYQEKIQEIHEESEHSKNDPKKRQEFLNKISEIQKKIFQTHDQIPQDLEQSTDDSSKESNLFTSNRVHKISDSFFDGYTFFSSLLKEIYKTFQRLVGGRLSNSIVPVQPSLNREELDLLSRDLHEALLSVFDKKKLDALLKLVCKKEYFNLIPLIFDQNKTSSIPTFHILSAISKLNKQIDNADDSNKIQSLISKLLSEIQEINHEDADVFLQYVIDHNDTVLLGRVFSGDIKVKEGVFLKILESGLVRSAEIPNQTLIALFAEQLSAKERSISKKSCENLLNELKRPSKNLDEESKKQIMGIIKTTLDSRKLELTATITSIFWDYAISWEDEAIQESLFSDNIKFSKNCDRQVVVVFGLEAALQKRRKDWFLKILEKCHSKNISFHKDNWENFYKKLINCKEGVDELEIEQQKEMIAAIVPHTPAGLILDIMKMQNISDGTAINAKLFDSLLVACHASNIRIPEKTLQTMLEKQLSSWSDNSFEKKEALILSILKNGKCRFSLEIINKGFSFSVTHANKALVSAFLLYCDSSSLSEEGTNAFARQLLVHFNLLKKNTKQLMLFILFNRSYIDHNIKRDLIVQILKETDEELLRYISCDENSHLIQNLKCYIRSLAFSQGDSLELLKKKNRILFMLIENLNQLRRNPGLIAEVIKIACLCGDQEHLQQLLNLSPISVNTLALALSQAERFSDSLIQQSMMTSLNQAQVIPICFSDEGKTVEVSLEAVRRFPRLYLNAIDSEGIPNRFELIDSPADQRAFDAGGITKQFMTTLCEALIPHLCLTDEKWPCLPLTSSDKVENRENPSHVLTQMAKLFLLIAEKNQSRSDKIITGALFNPHFFELVKVVANHHHSLISKITRILSHVDPEKQLKKKVAEFLLPHLPHYAPFLNYEINPSAENKEKLKSYYSASNSSVEIDANLEDECTQASHEILASYLYPAKIFYEGVQETLLKNHTLSWKSMSDLFPQGEPVSSELLLSALDVQENGLNADPKFLEKIEWLKEKIRSSDGKWQVDFLKAISGQASMSPGMKLVIQAHSEESFQFSTCFNKLYIPNIEMDKETFLAAFDFDPQTIGYNSV